MKVISGVMHSRKYKLAVTKMKKLCFRSELTTAEGQMHEMEQHVRAEVEELEEELDEVRRSEAK